MITILQAVYASNNKGVDVTGIVAGLVSTGNDDVPATNEALGGDPDPGSTKYLMVWYSAANLNGGSPVGLACSEGTTIDLMPTSGAPPQYSTAAQPMVAASTVTAVVVDKAVYGTGVNGYDVTAICQAIFNQGALTNDQSGTYSVPIGNDTFGGDPNSGSVKSFAMTYTMNGAGPFYIGAQEGQTLNLPASPQAAAPDLIAIMPAAT
jgi:hypothetical protein